MTVELMPLCMLTIFLEPPIPVGPTPAGMRTIFEVGSATVEGDRLSGKIRGTGNADWLTVASDGTGLVDVRVLMETDDGALVFVQYQGRTDFATSATAPVYVAPRFETGDERYAWLNKVQALGKGFFDGTALVYEIYEVR